MGTWVCLNLSVQQMPQWLSGSQSALPFAVPQKKLALLAKSYMPNAQDFELVIWAAIE